MPCNEAFDCRNLVWILVGHLGQVATNPFIQCGSCSRDGGGAPPSQISEVAVAHGAVPPLHATSIAARCTLYTASPRANTRRGTCWVCLGAWVLGCMCLALFAFPWTRDDSLPQAIFYKH